MLKCLQLKWTTARSTIYFLGHCLCVLVTLKCPFAKASAAQPDDKSAQSSECDMRNLAPRRPASFDEGGRASLAIPQSGNTLSSVSQDWFTQQAHLMTNGGDQRLLENLNRSFNNAFSSGGADETSEISESDRTAGGDPASNLENPAKQPKIMPPVASKSDSFTQSVRFASLNRLEFALAPETRLNCSLEGSNFRVDLSQPISKNLEFNIRYDSSRGSNTVRFHYNW